MATGSNIDRRLDKIRRLLDPDDDVVEVIICWHCAGDDHDPDCPCYGKKFDKVITWEDIDD